MITFHLVPSPVWDAQRHGDVYMPEAFATDGFVHCTDGEQAVIDTANRYYQGDPRAYVVLSIDTDALSAVVKLRGRSARVPARLRADRDLGRDRSSARSSVTRTAGSSA